MQNNTFYTFSEVYGAPFIRAGLRLKDKHLHPDAYMAAALWLRQCSLLEGDTPEHVATSFVRRQRLDPSQVNVGLRIAGKCLAYGYASDGEVLFEEEIDLGLHAIGFDIKCVALPLDEGIFLRVCQDDRERCQVLFLREDGDWGQLQL